MCCSNKPLVKYRYSSQQIHIDNCSEFKYRAFHYQIIAVSIAHLVITAYFLVVSLA